MHILFNGDSFTEGQELGENYLNLRYSARICKELGIVENNLSKSGSSNDRIKRTTLEYCQTNQVDQIILCWSYPDRLMYTGDAPSSKDSQYGLHWKSTSPLRAKYYKHKPWVQFYRDIWTDEMMRNNFIMNCITMQEFCQNRQIKLIMSHICKPEIFRGFKIDSLFEMITMLDEEGFTAPPNMSTGDNIHPNSIIHSRFAHKLLKRLQ
jgi:hypothetical protein